VPRGSSDQPSATGITICVMEKTTVYLPDDLKAQLKRTALLRGVSEATVIRDAIRVAVSDNRPRPRGGLYAGSEPIAERADGLLEGFGER